MRQSDQRQPFPAGQVLLVGFGGDIMGHGPDEREAMQRAVQDALESARDDPDPNGCAMESLRHFAKAEFVYVVSESPAHIEALARFYGFVSAPAVEPVR